MIRVGKIVISRFFKDEERPFIGTLNAEVVAGKALVFAPVQPQFKDNNIVLYSVEYTVNNLAIARSFSDGGWKVRTKTEFKPEFPELSDEDLKAEAAEYSEYKKSLEPKEEKPEAPKGKKSK